MTSNPASLRARAMILAPRSWPSSPTLPTRSRTFLSPLIVTAAPGLRGTLRRPSSTCRRSRRPRRRPVRLGRRDLRHVEDGLRSVPRRPGAAVTMSGERKVRLLVGKVGLDGHDRGAKIIARALRDAGFEVIYTGLHQTPEMVVATALQEDVDGIGLSLLSGAHNTIFPKILRLLAEKTDPDIAVFGGGIIPDAAIPALQRAGVRQIFTPGASTQDVVEWVKTNVPPRRR